MTERLSTGTINVTDSDITLSTVAFKQMCEVIVQTLEGSALEDAFWKSVGSKRYVSLNDAVYEWFISQLSKRNEELLEVVFQFFITKLLHEFRGHRLQ